MRRRVRAVLIGGAAVIVMNLAAPGAGLAHGQVADVELACATPDQAAPLAKVCTVQLTYPDGDTVTGARVRLGATRDGGQTRAVGPITLIPQTGAGAYSGAIEFPAYGRWDIDVEVDGPAAGTAVLRQEILPPTPDNLGDVRGSLRLVFDFGAADVRNLAIRLSHLLAMTVWLGAVVGVGAAVRDGDATARRDRLAWWAGAFPWIGIGALTMIAGTGVLNAVFNAPTGSPGVLGPSRVADLPFGPAYLATFAVKLGLGVALGAATLALARALRRGWGSALLPAVPGPGTPRRSSERRIALLAILNVGLAGLTLAVTVVLGYLHMISHVGGAVGNG